MGLVTNLVTGNPQQWPRALRPVASYSPAIGAVLLVVVGAKAGWEFWRGGVRRPDWAGGNPYPGLVAYTERWAGVFFGRSREVDDLLTRVREARTVGGRFVPVVGPSGSGKSSLVLAGLVPALGDGSGFRVLPSFSPGTNAVGELAGVLGVDVSAPARAVLTAARAGLDPPRLDDVLAALTKLRMGARRLVMVVDQLEEAVTQCVEEDRQSLLALLEALLAQEPRLRVVVTVRSDTIGEFQQGPGRDLFRDPLMVNVMGPREIRLVVSEPARVTATTFDDGLVDEIVRDAGGGDALPLLSYLLSDLYRTAGRDGHISWREYQSSGGVSGAITRRAEAAARELGPDTLPLCLDTLLLFVTLGQGGATRQRVPVSTLDERERAVVEAFVDARLLTSDRVEDGVDGPEVVYDIAHEALLRQWQPLREHILLQEDNLRRLTELAPLARAWTRSGRRPDYLISGARLADALAWARSDRTLAPEVRQFLDESERNQAGELDRRANRVAREALAAVADAPELASGLALAAYTELAPTPLAGYALETALASGILQVIRHPRPVVSLAFAADGRLAIAPDGPVVEVWDPVGTMLHRLDGHTDGVTALGFAPDGRLASAARDGTLRLWGVDGRAEHAAVAAVPRPTALAFTAEGDLAVGTVDGTVRLFDAELRAVGTLPAGAPVYGLAAAVDGRLAAGCGDGSVLVWGADRVLTHRLPGFTDTVYTVAFGVHGELAGGGRDPTVRIWDDAGREVGRRAGHVHDVTAVAFAPDGALACGTSDGVVRVWTPGGRLAHALTEPGDAVRAVAFAPDGRLAVGSADATTRVWDLTGRLACEITDGCSTTLAYAADGGLVVASPYSGVRLWPDPGLPPVRLPDSEPVVALAATAAGYLAGGGHDHCVLVWDLATATKPAVLTGHTAPVGAVAFTADGRLASGAADGEVRLWSVDGRCLTTWQGDVGPVAAIVGTADGGIVVAGDDLAWLAGADLRAAAPSHRRVGPVRALAVAADGRVAAGGADGTVHTWDGPGRPHQTLGRHAGAVTAAAYAPDGRLATGSTDGEVRVWDVDGRYLHGLVGRGGAVSAVAFASDGRLAVCCDGVVRVWPYGTPLPVLAGLTARHARRPLTAQEREAAMLAPVPASGR